MTSLHSHLFLRNLKESYIAGLAETVHVIFALKLDFIIVIIIL